jgi:hypothetical protein
MTVKSFVRSVLSQSMIEDEYIKCFLIADDSISDGVSTIQLFIVA